MSGPPRSAANRRRRPDVHDDGGLTCSGNAVTIKPVTCARTASRGSHLSRAVARPDDDPGPADTRHGSTAGTSTRECGMRCDHSARGRLGVLLLAFALLVLGSRPECRADRVIMKNGLVYVSQGTPDKDNSLRLHLGRPQAGRGARLEGREDGPGQRLPDRRAVPVDPADHGARRLDAQGGHQRRGRAVGRPRPARLPLPGLEVEPDDPDGAGDHRDRPAHRPLSRASTGSGSASSRPARCRTR